MSAPTEGAATALRAMILLIVSLVIGCGGGSSKGPRTLDRGGVSFTVKWPARSGGRIIPIKADTITITLTNVPAKPGAQTLSYGNDKNHPPLRRPFRDAGGTSTYTRDDFPSGKYTVDVEAYSDSDPNPDKPTALAGGSGTIEIRGNETKNVTVTMGSTVTQVIVSAAASSVAVGGTTTLTATPRDKDGNMVLVGASTVTWKSSDPMVATVDGTGLSPTVHALKAGSVSFTATFNEVELTLGQKPIASAPFALNVVDALHVYGIEDGLNVSRVNTDGSGQTVLYAFPSGWSNENSVAVSIDSSRITFEEISLTGLPPRITILDGTTGGLLSRFNVGSADHIVKWVESGSIYLYQLEEMLDQKTNPTSVVRTDQQGNGRVSLYTVPEGWEDRSGQISISPDGSRVALVEHNDYSGADRITVLDALSGSVLDRFTVTNVQRVECGPNSLYFSENSNDGSGLATTISRIGIDGSGRTILYSLPGTSQWQSYGNPISVSPDGLSIAVEEYNNVSHASRITVLGRDGSVQSRFTSTFVGLKLRP